IGKEFFAKSIVAVVAASLLILLYIAFRFKKIGGWPAGSMAVVALVHDLIVIFGVFIIMRIPLNGNFIAALLTILGYSINDTVVIYDRIRENRQLMGDKMPFEELVNLSINQSLTRSINTTVSTVLALGCVCIVSGVFGLDSIFTFAFPLIIGMVSGVYSTVCIAGPLWVEWENYKLRKNPKQKSSKA
ncbi:MAG: protein translocase subunit SecF, partial [Oscillospiraceae bacterium]